jgi:hypothetical protein
VPDSYDISGNFTIQLYGPDKLAQLAKDDALIALCPPAGTDFNQVVWEQPENGYGLLSLRGPNGYPAVTGVPGYRRMTMSPGYYGEKALITEKEMNESREYGTAADPMDVEKRIGYIQEQILKRAVDRMRLIISELFRTGRFVVADPAGRTTHADTLDGYASRNVFSPAIQWAANASTAKPIDDLQAWQAALQLGTDSVFDEDSVLLASTPTINDILATNQIRSILKLDYGATAVGVKKLNDILVAAGLPRIQRYDEDYFLTEADAKARANAQRFIPAKSLIWKGHRRDGAPPAQFQLTRSATKNPPAGVAQNAPGYKFAPPAGRLPMAAEFEKALYTVIQYQLVPAEYQIDVGFNGGPAVPYATCFAGISYT